LRVMVKAISHSMLSLAYVVLMLFMIIYVFAIYFVYISTSPDLNDEVAAELLLYFDRVGASSFNLFLCVTGGIAWGDIAKPLSEVGWHSVAVMSFFMSLMLFAALNIITGVFVEGAISRAQDERESLVEDEIRKERETRGKLNALFAEIDVDNSGFIDLSEFELMLSRAHVQAVLHSIGLRFSKTWDLFRLLDKKGSHKVALEEFVDGCMQLCGHDSSVDIATILDELKRLEKSLLHQVKAIELNIDSLGRQAVQSK